ncbi:MAG TPA: hypothetical protein VJS43_00865 [Candidatus Acidoferrales bacterium]|nr:hypothetical protein [Candidatus Acidoferrales bacterium]
MSARTDYRWSPRSTAVAVALPYGAAMEVVSMREKLSIIRDTLIVLGMQIAFRTAQLLRHLNY